MSPILRITITIPAEAEVIEEVVVVVTEVAEAVIITIIITTIPN